MMMVTKEANLIIKEKRDKRDDDDNKKIRPNSDLNNTKNKPDSKLR